MKKVWFIALSVLILCSACTSTKQAQPAPPKSPKEEKDMDVQVELLSLMQLMEFVRTHYVDEDKVTYKQLIQGAMKGMLNNLDPHSNYETPRNFSFTMAGTRGSFAGIGATVRKNDDGEMELVKVLPKHSADKAGLKKGDILLSADGFSFKDKKLDECVSKLRGKRGTSVILKIRRNKQEKEIVVKRDIVKTPSIVNRGIIQDKIGYFRINQFTSTTAEELDEYLKQYGKKIDRLIVDLRFNPGGQLQETVEVLSRFLEKGLLIVSVEGRSEGKVVHEAVACKKYRELPIAVLINEHSASASEIFAGCMKDYKRGIVIGTKSFGKGSVQRIYPMPDGGGARITIAKYYTPSRNVIHGKGIMPDVVVKLKENEKRALAEHIMKDDEKPLPIKDKGYKDIQLEKAVQIVKGLKNFRMSK
ncbi:MAG: S41 family peptidase [Lentisphaeria bacterium]|nr:S41 family peptidase [Lentisphaeria bacterium]